MLNGLCALISVARRRAGAGAGVSLRPFLQVGLHLWVRELRRMVCGLHEESTEGSAEESADRREGAANGAAEFAAGRNGETSPSTGASPGAVNGMMVPRRLRFSDDLKPDEPSIHLPLIQVPRVSRHRLGRRQARRRAAPRARPAGVLQPVLSPRRRRGVPVPGGRAAERTRLRPHRLRGVRHGAGVGRYGLHWVPVGASRPRLPAPVGREGSRRIRASEVESGLPLLRRARGADHRRRARRKPAERDAGTGPGVALQRRSESDRLLGQRPGRGASRRVLRGADRGGRPARGGRPGRRSARRHRAGGSPCAGGGVVARPGRQPRGVRRRALRQRVHRAGPAVAA